jgi:hypothetical protein
MKNQVPLNIIRRSKEYCNYSIVHGQEDAPEVARTFAFSIPLPLSGQDFCFLYPLTTGWPLARTSVSSILLPPSGQ